MITVEIIDSIQAKILERVEDQVSNGKQSKSWPGVFACGQFLDIKGKEQRGVHGSSAALRILADSTDGTKYKNLIAGLIKYLEGRRSLEKDQPEETKIVRDESNVIKICETLYALSFVKPGLANKDSYVQKLHSLLADNIIDGKGWGYFLNDNKDIKLLPTAFAVMSLEKTGYPVGASAGYMEGDFKIALEKEVNDPVQFAKYVFCLFVLAYSKEILSTEEKKRYKKYFSKLVHSAVCNLREDLEQNFEYWPEVNDWGHEYIRIPWQLYLAAISVKLSPWYFSKIKTQKILKNIEDKSLSLAGFIYPHSGHHLSTRTQAILFDVLAKIKSQLHREYQYKIYNVIDRFISLFRSRWFKILCVVAIISLSVFSVYKWLFDPQTPPVDPLTKLKDLGPEVIAEVLFFLYFFSTRNTQK